MCTTPYNLVIMVREDGDIADTEEVGLGLGTINK